MALQPKTSLGLLYCASAATLLQPLTPKTFHLSSTTASSQHRGFPTGFLHCIRVLSALFGSLCYTILIRCPAYRSLCILMNSCSGAFLISRYISLLYVAIQIPLSCTGPSILQSTFLPPIIHNNPHFKRHSVILF